METLVDLFPIATEQVNNHTNFAIDVSIDALQQIQNNKIKKMDKNPDIR